MLQATMLRKQITSEPQSRMPAGKKFDCRKDGGTVYNHVKNYCQVFYGYFARNGCDYKEANELIDNDSCYMNGL